MKEFKIRCSAIGKIMTNPRSKSETLSQTTKTYVDEWLKSEIFNRNKEIDTKYTIKGILMEDNSIDLLSAIDDKFYIKNEYHFENDFMKGTPDIITQDEIIDIKSSWSVFTFPYFDTEIPNNDYFYQLQGYMALTGKESARLAYVLSDAPDFLIEQEAKSMVYKKGYDFDSALDIAQKAMTFSDIQNEMKVKVFNIQRDNDVIEKINTRVLEIRDYIKQLNIK